MYKNKQIAVIVPCYNESKQISKVINTMPPFVDSIICVDDCSTDNTPKILFDLSTNDKRMVIINLKQNLGVGGAIDSGYGKALELEADLIAVMAGDGQMDPNELHLLIDALLLTKASYSKITRLYEPEYLINIPKIRLIGNSILSILTRISSGYWQMSDAQTGFTVITREALAKIQGNLWKKYGFPNDVLNKLGQLNVDIVEVPSKPIYGVGEVSKLKPYKVAIPILKLVLRGFIYRIKLQYFIRTLHPIGLGYALSFLGLSFGFLWLMLIFFIQFLTQHNTHPLQTIVSLFLFQSSIGLLWLTLMFDALLNKDNCKIYQA